MGYEGGVKKFTCWRCGLVSKRHNNITGMGICKRCDRVIGKEVAEARRLVSIGAFMPDRLMYLYKSGQLRLDIDAI